MDSKTGQTTMGNNFSLMLMVFALVRLWEVER